MPAVAGMTKVCPTSCSPELSASGRRKNPVPPTRAASPSASRESICVPSMSTPGPTTFRICCVRSGAGVWPCATMYCVASLAAAGWRCAAQAAWRRPAVPAAGGAGGFGGAGGATACGFVTAMGTSAGAGGAAVGTTLVTADGGSGGAGGAVAGARRPGAGRGARRSRGGAGGAAGRGHRSRQRRRCRRRQAGAPRASPTAAVPAGQPGARRASPTVAAPAARRAERSAARSAAAAGAAGAARRTGAGAIRHHFEHDGAAEADAFAGLQHAVLHRLRAHPDAAGAVEIDDAQPVGRALDAGVPARDVLLADDDVARLRAAQRGQLAAHGVRVSDRDGAAAFDDAQGQAAGERRRLGRSCGAARGRTDGRERRDLARTGTHLEHGGADPELLAGRDLAIRDALGAHPHAVAGTEIADADAVRGRLELGVLARHAAVVEPQARGALAADGDRRLEADLVARLERFRGDDAQDEGAD